MDIKVYNIKNGEKMFLKEMHKGQISWMKGKKHTPESLEKMSDALKGSIPWNLGLVGFMKGRIVSEETRKKMSDAQKKRYLGIIW